MTSRRRKSLQTIEYSLVVAISASAVATMLFATFAVLRHRAYHSMAMDFAFFDQIVWNTSQGRWFETSFVPHTFMGQHVEPILLLFAGLYWITPAPEWLLVTQAVSVGIAALLLYVLARERLSRPWLAILIGFAFLLSPTLHEGMAFDYHSEMMAAPFIFGGLVLLYQGRTWLGVGTLLGTLLLKEDAALVLIGVAMPLWLMQRRRAAITVSAVGLLWIVLVVGLYMPWARGASSDLEARYDHLGSGAGGIASGIVTNPIGAASHLIGPEQRMAVLRNVLAQGGIPLAAPASLLAAGPIAALQFLSSHPPQQSLRLHYGSQVLPLLLVATVEGFRRIEQSGHADRLVPAAGTLLMTGTVAGFLVSSPFSPLTRFDPDSYTPAEQRGAIRRAIERIPKDTSVSAQSGLAAHLSQREDIWEFPVLMNAEYVILDLDGVVSRPYEETFDNLVTDLPEHGYALIWSEGSVRIYWQTRE